MSPTTASTQGSKVQQAIATPVDQVVTKFHVVQHFTPKIVAVDIAASFGTAACTSIVVSMIDKTIMEKTLGLRPTIRGGMADGFKTLLTTPWRFFLRTEPCNNYAEVYRLVFLVYACTYLAGNLVQSYYESCSTSFYLEKFSAGSIVNVLLTLYKDNKMLQILPPKDGKKLPVPNVSRALFVVRDCLTVAASFWVAPIVAKKFRQMNPSLTERQASDRADLLVPASIQFISTPLHLYGIALKENPDKTQAELFSIVRKGYLPAVAARMCRIIPAFGFGMMFMKRVRSEGGDYVEGKHYSMKPKVAVA